jgi:uncharacterized damage-inducible protein DinB
MTIEQVFDQWQDVRNGFIKEVELIPADQLVFRATAETRSVLELVQHVIESERVIVREVCRDDTNFKRGFPTMIAEFATQVKDATTKDAVLELLRSSLEETKNVAVEFGDESFDKTMERFDGRQGPKRAMLSFAIAHEMYHRGQLTVYERLLGIEPALTRFFKKATGAS